MMLREVAMVRKIVQLMEAQSEALEQRAREQGTSFSEMVRRSIDAFLSQKPPGDDVRERAINAVGYAKSGRRDISVRHDDYLTEAYEQ
jgi:hypothetical protein